MDSWLGGADWTPVEPLSGFLAHGMDEFLLPAEDIVAEGRGVVLVNMDIAGTLCVTNYRLIFVIEGQRNIVPLGTIPLATIEKFNKQVQPMRNPSVSRGRDKAVSMRLLQVTGKDMRVIVYGFRPRTKQRKAVFDGLMRVMRPHHLWDLYAFTCGPSTFGNTDPRVRLHAEYLRLLNLPYIKDSSIGNEIYKEAKQTEPSQIWRLTDANSSYSLCSTYPSLFITSSSISDEELQQAAAFRARGRLPVMSWRHPKNGAVLARSSQPLIGLMMSNRSNADEKLVAALCVPQSSCQEHRKLYIADARPRKNAIANGALGGGSESSANYFQSEVVFLGIDNIHAMRESLTRLRDYLDLHGAASSDGSSSLRRSGGLAWGGGNLSSTAAAVSALGDSGWLIHVHSVLAGAAWIAARIALEGASVLVHCSDGWDRTTQLVSLAELMLDPYYRTFLGFQALVEKDWLAFGHPFADRLGMPSFTGGSVVAAEVLRQSTGSIGSTSPARLSSNSSFTSPGAHSPGVALNNFSPIFLQWVDCVAQLLRLYPRAFEFSSAFLVELLDCILSCRFGNFLCNSEKERLPARITDSTGCMWIYLEKLRSSKGKEHEHHNIFYNREQQDGLLLPPAAALAPTLWPHFFLRWACPSEISRDGSLPSSWTQGGELENQCRMLAQSFSGLKKSKEKAEMKVKELTARLKASNDELHAEKHASTSAVALTGRLRKENIAIKHAMQALGCKIHFSDYDSIFHVSSSDEEEAYEKKEADCGNASDRTHVIDRKSRAQSDELSVSVSFSSDTDMSAALVRKTCGDTACNFRSEDCCKWPQAGCARLGSSYVGFRVNFDALERLSIHDCYFNPEDDSHQNLCSQHSEQHQPPEVT